MYSYPPTHLRRTCRRKCLFLGPRATNQQMVQEPQANKCYSHGPRATCHGQKPWQRPQAMATATRHGHQSQPTSHRPKIWALDISLGAAKKFLSLGPGLDDANFLATQGSRTVTRLWRTVSRFVEQLLVFRDAASLVREPKFTLQLAAIAIYAYHLWEL